jgi:hypothetical protein
MSRRIHFLASLAALLLASPAPAATARPAAHSAGSCSVGDGKGYGYTYLTALSVSGTSCASGRGVVRSHGRARGWRCARKLLDRSSVQYDARWTCTSGSRRVVWTFAENT